VEPAARADPGWLQPSDPDRDWGRDRAPDGGLKETGGGLPVNPRATTSYHVFFLPRWSAGFHMVTEVPLLVIPRR
jgi:hypothetical protein